jgi:AraC family transcriptional regulator of adaptative response/methylated-DNA-[protein]-cysteine methyltransferase
MASTALSLTATQETLRDLPYNARIANAIGFVAEHYQEQPSLEEMADAANLSPFHFQRVFKRWAGVSPKRFLQYVTLAHAKRLLVDDASVLDAALDAGLSGPSRLHDLFVTCEAMTPGEFKALGYRLVIRWGLHDGALGRVLLGVTERGVCWLAVAAAAIDAFQRQWHGTTLVRDQASTADYVRRGFELRNAQASRCRLWRHQLPDQDLEALPGPVRAPGQLPGRRERIATAGSARGQRRDRAQHRLADRATG